MEEKNYPKVAFKAITSDMESRRGRDHSKWFIGEERHYKGTLEICHAGFHTAATPYEAWRYVKGDIMMEVERLGETIKGSGGHSEKYTSNGIKVLHMIWIGDIVREYLSRVAFVEGLSYALAPLLMRQRHEVETKSLEKAQKDFNADVIQRLSWAKVHGSAYLSDHMSSFKSRIKVMEAVKAEVARGKEAKTSEEIIVPGPKIPYPSRSERSKALKRARDKRYRENKRARVREAIAEQKRKDSERGAYTTTIIAPVVKVPTGAPAGSAFAPLSTIYKKF